MSKFQSTSVVQCLSSCRGAVSAKIFEKLYPLIKSYENPGNLLIQTYVYKGVSSMSHQIMRF